MTGKALPPDPKGDMMLGIIDALLAFGVSLANAGVMTRAEIAEAMADVLNQQAQRRGGTSPAIRYAPEVIKAFFELPVFAGRPN
jgi:hypothetical protein